MKILLTTESSESSLANEELFSIMPFSKIISYVRIILNGHLYRDVLLFASK